MLAVDRRLGGVQVLRRLRARGSVGQDPRAEPDPPALQVVDREGDACPEPVADRAVVAAAREPGLEQDLGAERAGLRERLQQVVARTGRVADPEGGGGLGRDAAALEVGARVGGLRRGARAAPRRPRRPPRWPGSARRGAGAAPALGGRVALVPQGARPPAARAARPPRRSVRCSSSRRKRDRVAALAASEAVEDLLGRAHAERRRLLLMERAQPDERVVARLLEREVLADELRPGRCAP